jgi:hypothetical protein
MVRIPKKTTRRPAEKRFFDFVFKNDFSLGAVRVYFGIPVEAIRGFTNNYISDMWRLL